MSSSTPTTPFIPPQTAETRWALGLTVFAGTLMAVGGVFHVLAGVSALFKDKVYAITPQYIYSFDLTSWGWTHIILGVLVGLAGLAVLRGLIWGRVVGVALASLSLIANFLFIPWYPLWSLLIIALDIVIIWALATYRREAV